AVGAEDGVGPDAHHALPAYDEPMMLRLGVASVALMIACAEPRRSTVDSGTAPISDGSTPDATLDPPTPTNCGALDIVFVIDTSTSMEDEIMQISAGMQSIWNAAIANTPDSQFSLVVFVDSVVAVNGCAPFTSPAALSTEFSSWAQFTQTNGQPGNTFAENFDCPENSLDALYVAATQCPWRPNSTRIVVHATDDTFGAQGQLLSEAFSVQHGYAEVLSALQANQLRLGTFAAPGVGEFCGVDTSPNVGQGFHEAYQGQPSLAMATGGQAFNIREVRAGTLNMATAISQLIDTEYCTLY
ncbi:MAG: hypothetical protein KC492_29415, partial [Myxococcales bacterium]|nr:hypothetical protein [Myxococcales bacterium]